MTREKMMNELSAEEKDAVLKKAKDGLALKLWELAIASGYSYNQIRIWKRQGLPLLDGKITLADAIKWRKELAAKKESEAVAGAPA
jgi:hypothetical protein